MDWDPGAGVGSVTDLCEHCGLPVGSTWITQACLPALLKSPRVIVSTVGLTFDRIEHGLALECLNCGNKIEVQYDRPLIHRKHRSLTEG